ncbi:MAG TPA: 8-amino-7-oxononanoate synthase [Acidimicrobiales bacterium]|nr:8-amino-7-oxononanoate synthase [Acidimicrobiales bacterium]
MADTGATSHPGWEVWGKSERKTILDSGRWRSLRPLDGGGPRFSRGGTEVVSFASNDYLGLSQHPDVKSAAARALDRLGTGSGSSRLIVGDRPLHHSLEEALADWRGTESALVFPTGYQANIAAMTTFGAGARIVSDELNHASLIDGARLARADVAVYRHGDLDHARSLVCSAEGRVLVVSDSVFSMDGDVAPVVGLSEICARHGALLVLDDAHAVFPLDEPDPEALVVRIGTLSKALGSQGGYIAASRDWIELLVNRARPFIFTTGLAPASAAAALEAVRISRSEEGSLLRKRLRERIDMVRAEHPSPVVPLILGSEEAAVAASNNLLDQGLLVPAIRPPTVPPGTSRLRVSLSAAHETSDVALLRDALTRLL